MHLDESFNAGMFAINFVGAPGTHGAAITGVHGAGVKNTGGGLLVAGLTTELHIPKGRILTKGLLSMILAAGILAARTLLTGRTIKAHGATPKEHIICAPFTT